MVAQPKILVLDEATSNVDTRTEKLIGEARQAFRARDPETGWSKYEEVVNKYYAARRYRVVKRWLKDRN